MNAPTKSATPERMWLSIGVTLGFFATLFCVFVFGVPDSGGEVLMIMVGALVSKSTQIIGYHFGSSAGSKSKEDALLARDRAPEPTRDGSNADNV